ncbi:MAG: ATP12 family chaperone protein [Hyphomicrobiaceae bacterium]
MSEGEDSANGNGRPIIVPGREATARPLPRRFYTDVSLGVSGPPPAHTVLLGGRIARTPGKRPLELPRAALAEAVAREWASQATHIDPAAMPLTRLVNTAIDGVAERMTEVAADVVKYAGSDLLCYRADFPEGLIARQRTHWDPVLEWAAQAHGAHFVVAQGIMPVLQPAGAIARIAEAVARLDALRLTALHVMTTLMGSAILALAVVEGCLSPENAWEAAHVDEDWQIAEWGEDAEASARREKRWAEMRAAAELTRLVVA